MKTSKIKIEPEKSFFRYFLIKIKCFLGFHHWQVKHNYFIRSTGLDGRFTTIPRRIPAQLQVCKHCLKDRIVYDVDNSIL